MQMGNANLNPWTEAKVNTKNPDRGPLLIIEGEKDHTVPWAIANAAYKRQRHNPGVTEIVKIPNRGHALTLDHGWQEVARPHSISSSASSRPSRARPGRSGGFSVPVPNLVIEVAAQPTGPWSDEKPPRCTRPRRCKVP